MNAQFYVIGVGPGDPDLMTIKAVKRLRACPVLVVPKGTKDGPSTALDIIRPHVDLAAKEVAEIHFPMKKIRMNEPPDPEVAAAWRAAAGEIGRHIRAGRDVAFPTLGDPAIYSTGFYTCQALSEAAPEIPVRFVPGVAAMNACSAAAGLPLCQGDDMLAVVPATFANHRLRRIFNDFQTVVLMKVHRVLPRVIGLLGEAGLLDKAVLVERTSRASEQVFTDLSSLGDRPMHYFSTIIVRTR